MEKLERLIQGRAGRLYQTNGTELHRGRSIPIGKICTLVVQNNTSISIAIDEMATRDSVLIPVEATAYIASDFSGDTQHVRRSNLKGEEKMYSVYALQFYYVSPSDY